MAKRYDREEQDAPRYNTKPPIPEERLSKIVQAWRKHRGNSEYVPRNYVAAATWWLDKQEPQYESEAPTVGYDKNGDQYWTTPYIERVAATLRKFLELSDPQKCFVLECIAVGIPYRGDDIRFYKAVVEEHHKMQEAISEGRKDEYIDEGFEKMQKALTGMQV